MILSYIWKFGNDVIFIIHALEIMWPLYFIILKEFHNTMLQKIPNHQPQYLKMGRLTNKMSRI